MEYYGTKSHSWGLHIQVVYTSIDLENPWLPVQNDLPMVFLPHFHRHISHIRLPGPPHVSQAKSQMLNLSGTSEYEKKHMNIWSPLEGVAPNNS